MRAPDCENGKGHGENTSCEGHQERVEDEVVEKNDAAERRNLDPEVDAVGKMSEVRNGDVKSRRTGARNAISRSR